jgi:hypothetical protein
MAKGAFAADPAAPLIGERAATRRRNAMDAALSAPV